MIIDGHAHACGDFLTARQIVKILDEEMVDKVILVPGERNSTRNYSLPELAQLFPNQDVVKITNVLSRIAISLSKTAEDIPEGNHYVYSLAQAYPDRIIQFLWVLIGKPATLDTMETHLSEWEYKGIKLHHCWDNFSINSNGFGRVVKFAANHGLPIFIHIRTYQEVSALIEFIRHHPEAVFIIGHLFGLSRFVQARDAMRNVYFDISNSHLVSTPRVCQAIDAFGADRIVLGSDTPYGKRSLGLNIERVKALPIREDEKVRILGKNLQALLNL